MHGFWNGYLWFMVLFQICRKLLPSRPRKQNTTMYPSQCRIECTSPWRCGPCWQTWRRVSVHSRYVHGTSGFLPVLWYVNVVCWLHHNITELLALAFLSPFLSFKDNKLFCFHSQSTKAVYDRIIDLRIATPQIIINYAMFLEEHSYFEESFKVKPYILL